MLIWIRVLIIGVLVSILPISGRSQEIIYDGNSALKGNNLPFQSQIGEKPLFTETQAPLTTDMPAFVSERGSQPEPSLFDLTATIPEDGNYSQTDPSAIDQANSTIKTENNALLENNSSFTQDNADKSQSEMSDLLQSSESLFGDNTSDLDKLISELFPAEKVRMDAQTNDLSDNLSQAPSPAILPKEQTLEDTDYAAPAVSVGLRNLTGVGLVTTGIADWQLRKMPFSTLLWSGSKPHHLHYLYQMSEPYGASKTINSLVYSSIIRKSAPPSGVAGNSELSHSLVVDRIEWLARAGYSNALADLIRKLPEDDQRWDEWQRWLGAYDLLSYNDAVTCAKADRKVSQDFDAFWLKIQIICKIIDGGYEDALFLAELMSTSGEEDPLFFAFLDNFRSSQSGNIGLG